MPLVTKKALRGTYEDLLAGRRKLVIWGVRENYFLNLWQITIPVAYVVDGNWRLWDTQIDGVWIRSPLALIEEDVRHAALMISYTHEPTCSDIARFVDKRIKIPMFLPVALPELYRQLRPLKRNPVSLGPTEAVKELKNELIPLLRRKRPWMHASAFTAAGQKARKVDLFSSYTLADLGRSLELKPHPIDAEATKRVLLVNTNISLGGSQRQLMNLALALKTSGLEPTFVVLGSDRPHIPYVDFLRGHDIPLISLTKPASDPHHASINGIAAELSPHGLLDYIRNELTDEQRFLLWQIPQTFLLYILNLYIYLQEKPAHLMIAYLDWANVTAAVASILMGTGHVIMTGRNVDPGQMPHFFETDLASLSLLYSLAIKQHHIRFANNSDVGAAAYADWLKIPKASIRVIPNSLTDEFYQLASPAECRDARKRYGIAPRDTLIVGAFRFSPEKQPLIFLAVIAKLLKFYPDLRVVICGNGPLLAQMQRFIELNKLTRCVTVSSATAEIKTLMAAATLTLLTSNAEGAPNVLIESQAQGTPVVTTRAGGVETNLIPALYPFIAEIGDLNGLVAACRKLLDDPALSRKLGREARRYVLANFTSENLLERNLALAKEIEGAAIPASARKERA